MCRDTATTTYAVSVRDAKDDEEVEIETCYFVRFEGGGPFARCLESNEPAISEGGAAGDTVPVAPDDTLRVRVKIVRVEAEETLFDNSSKIQPASVTRLEPDDV